MQQTLGLAVIGMLSVFETSEMIELIRPALNTVHPLLLWKAAFDDAEHGQSDHMEDASDSLAATCLRYAERGWGDPYCDAVAMSSYAWEPYLPSCDPALRPKYLDRFTDRLIALADAAKEPVLQLWIADAAWTRMDHADPAEAGELQMLVCRLACQLEAPPDVIIAQFLRSLWMCSEQALTVDQYVANGGLEAVTHLRNLADTEYESFLVLLEARFLSARAIFDADQGRREGVKLHGDIIRAKLNRLIASWDNPGHRPELHIPGVDWDIGDYRNGLDALADAELLVGMPSRALATWKFSSGLWPRDGDTDDIELLRRVFALCYPNVRFEP